MKDKNEKRSLTPFEHKLLSILESLEGPQKAEEIVSALNRARLETDKTAVNRGLYYLRGQGLVVRDREFRWSIRAPTAEEPPSSAQTDTSWTGASPTKHRNGPMPDTRLRQNRQETERTSTTKASSSRLQTDSNLSDLVSRALILDPGARVSDLPAIPARLETAFRRKGIERVRQLASLSDENLLRWRSVGQVSLEKLKDSLRRFLEHGSSHAGRPLHGVGLLCDRPEAAAAVREFLDELADLSAESPVDLFQDLPPDEIRAVAQAISAPSPKQDTQGRKKVTFVPIFLDGGCEDKSTRSSNIGLRIGSILQGVPPREEKILRSRTLRDKSSQRTLEELGEHFNLSRERIRQLEVKAIKQLKPSLRRLFRDLDEEIEKLRTRLKFPLTLSLLEHFQPAFRGVSQDADLYEELLKLGGSNHAIRSLPGLEEPIVTLRKASKGDLMERVREEILRESEIADFGGIYKAIQDFMTRNGMPELTFFAMGWIDGALLTEHGLVFAPKITDLLTATLRAAEKPLTIEEIEVRLRQAGHQLRESTVRGALSRTDETVHVGSGTYSLRSKPQSEKDPAKDEQAQHIITKSDVREPRAVNQRTAGLDALLGKFLQERGLEAADGRPLYAYRCSDSEFQSLGAALQAIAPNLGGLIKGPGGPIAGQAYCIFASEWWRREHQGGPWSWEPILDEVDMSDIGWQHELYPLIELGLDQWDRDLIRGPRGDRRFLDTIACEGGLPLKLVRQDGASLQRFFKAVLEDYGVFCASGESATSLARRRAKRLPRSLRQDVVFELAGDLVEAIWELQSQVPEADHPVEELDRKKPGWREDLPLELSDETARALLNNLVTEAKEVRRRTGAKLKAVRWIQRSGKDWRLNSTVSMGASLEPSVLAEIFDFKENELPQSFSLEVEAIGSGQPEVLGIGRLVSGKDGVPKFRLDVREVTFTGQAAAAELRVSLLEATQRLAYAQPHRGQGLGDLPWIFIASQPGPKLRGIGSVRLQQEECWLALSPSALTSLDQLRDHESRDLRRLSRRVVQLNESIELDSEDATCKIVLGASAPGRGRSVRLLGPSLDLSDSQIFLGLPRFRVFSASGQPEATHSNLTALWRPRRASGAWRVVDKSCVGEIQFRLISEDGPIFQDRLRILPEGSKVEIHPKRYNKGRIELSGLGECRTGLLQPEEVSADIKETTNGLRIELEAPDGKVPAMVTLRIEWSTDQKLDLELPFPSQGCRVIGINEEVLDVSDNIPLALIDRYHVVASTTKSNAQIELQATLLADDVPKDVPLELHFPLEVGRAQLRLPLRSVQEPLGRLFALSGDLDAQLHIRFQSNVPLRPRPLLVSRFDLLIEPDRELNMLTVTTSEGDRPQDTDFLELAAYRFWAPEEPRISLDRVAPGKWSFPATSLDPGPWLVVGLQGDWARTRPLRWTVPDENGCPPEEDLKSDLQRAVCILDEESRRAAIRDALVNAERDSNDPSWNAIQAYVEWLEFLPSSSLDLAVILPQYPRALALAIVRSSLEHLETFWSALEQLPFEWYQVPLEAWTAASKTQLKSNRSEVSDPEIQALTDSELLASFLDDAIEASHRWFLRPILDWIRLRVLDDFENASTLLGDTQNPKYLLDLIDKEFQDLIHRRDEHWWPPSAQSLHQWHGSVSRETKNRYWQQLCRSVENHASYRKPVFLAPLAAALTCVEKSRCAQKGLLMQQVLLKQREIRAFDHRWFDRALELGLRLFISQKFAEEEGTRQ